MDNFWDFISLVAILGTILTGVFLILLSLPNSRLRKALSWVVGFFLLAVSCLCGTYVASPIDVIPDFIPLLGQLDDLAAGIGVFSGIAGIATLVITQINASKERKSLEQLPKKDTKQIEDKSQTKELGDGSKES